LSALRSLLIFGMVFTATAFGFETLCEIAGPLEYKGYLVFVYTEGENPINHIAFTVDMTIAPDLLILDVPAGWGHIYNGRVLSLSGGSLSPGGTVKVQVSLSGHHPPGSYPIDSSGTTTAGELVLSSGMLMVGDLYILNFLTVLNSLRYPIFASTLGFGLLEIWKRLKREEKAFEDSLEYQSDDGIELAPSPPVVLDSVEGEVITPDDPFESLTIEPEPEEIDPGEPQTLPLDEPPGLLELDIEPESEPGAGAPDSTSYEDLYERAVNRVYDHNPGWADHGIHDPRITILKLLNSMTQELGYHLNYSLQDMSFLNGHELTVGQIRELLIDSISSASETYERVSIKHIKVALEKLKKD